jgi:hypothetical protein
MELQWSADLITQRAARNYPLPLLAKTPAPQYAGHTFRANSWRHRILKSDDFLADPITCSAPEIIRHFQAGQDLAGLALVVSWGGMARASRYIYDRYSLQDIRNALVECRRSINENKKIEDAWHILTRDLEWSAVISSKTLHFVCRSLGCNSNPPAAIDNAVMLSKVWPAFKQQPPKSLRLESWAGKPFENYNRYMTFILELATARDWTTTEVETTLFAEYA